MGTIYQAKCPCGYEQIDLLDGCGMSTLDLEYIIHACPHCHAVYSRRYGEDRESYTSIGCKQCGKNVENLVGDLDGKPLICPLCGEEKLRLSITGQWD